MKFLRMSTLATVAGGLLIWAALPTGAYADVLDLSWSGAFGSGSAIANATNEGGGKFLVTSLEDGTQNGVSISLLNLDVYSENDNLLFPSGACGGSEQNSCSVGSYLLDGFGLAFSDGTNDYLLWKPIAAGAGVSYYECSSAQAPSCNGYTYGHPLTSFLVTPVPEPKTIWLFATVGLCLFGVGTHRKCRA